VTFFADTSFFSQIALKQRYTAAVEKLRTKHRLCPLVSDLVAAEFHCVALRHRPAAWTEWKASAGDWYAEPALAVDWPAVFGLCHRLLAVHADSQPAGVDAVHVATAVWLGATHFISFDENSRQRRFARAAGLRLVPDRMPGDPAWTL
jgi:predicted nucleic acid-binding protein